MLRVDRLNVAGAKALYPKVNRDHRGHFVTTYSTAVSERPAAHDSEPSMSHFLIAQVSHSRSRRGIARGIHFTTTPPGCAKLVWCAAGAALDFVVDLRVGSPTFGTWDQVTLDPEQGCVLSLPVGLGHGYVATADDTVMTYLLSTTYVPEHEQALAFTDADLGLPVPADAEMSERDSNAPTLRDWESHGGLPEFDECQRLDDELRAQLSHQAVTSASLRQ